MVDTSKPNPRLGGSIKHKIVNPDLQEERDKRTFDFRELEKFFFTEYGRDELHILTKYCKEHPDLKIDFS